MLGTKEFYDMMNVFEATVGKEVYGHRFDRENTNKANGNVIKGAYYQDGEVNQMFIAFMHGYQYAKSIANQGGFD